MTVIYTSENVHLEKNKKNEYKMKILWEGPTKSFWVNFPTQKLKIVKQKSDDTYKIFTINADDILTLKDFLKKTEIDYNIAIYFLQDIGLQMTTLENFNMSVPFFNIDDFIVSKIDNKIFFFYVNDIKVISFDDNNLMDIDKIPDKSKFLSPEFKNITTIPNKVHYKSYMYSLAMLIIYCYLNEYIDDKNKNKILGKIYYTKLYWALQRMLQELPEDRYNLII